MRALLDANLLITYLLNPNSESAAVRIVRAGVTGAYRILVPESLLLELQNAASGRPYLAERSASEALERLLQVLRRIGEVLPSLDVSVPAVARDPKDDYLLAYAVAFGADVLVTGDRDLLVLGEAAGVLILSPARFLEALQEAGRL
ncbi:MAG: putative toxin-antitoxin system toxin component, PIN family [Chloroflexi bacterium]|nr:putative toxin-antitoxin system toxin component, PIN family [Chloroflexota bacterium]